MNQTLARRAELALKGWNRSFYFAVYTSEKPGDARYTKSGICTIVSFYCVEFIVLLSKGLGSLLCYLWRNLRHAIHLVHGALAEKWVKVLDKWVKLSVNVACAKVVVAGFITANARARLTTSHAKMAPSTNPARTSVKKCLLSAIRLQPTNRDSETATTCSNGLSNLVSVLTAAWRYN